MELTNENYYSKEANLEYISVSQYKDFKKCEFYGLMKALGEFVEPKSTALLAGGYADSYFSGKLEQYKLENPQIFKKDGTLKSDYEKANECINVALNDEFFMSKLSGEKQLILTGKINGCKVKGALDFLNDDIVDLKLVASIRELAWNDKKKKKLNFIENYDYDTQGAVYQELVRQNYKTKKPFDIAALSKEDEPDKAIIRIEDDILEEKLKEFADYIPRINAIKSGVVEPEHCGCCPCCRKYNKLNRVVSYKELFNKGDNDVNIE